MMERYERAQLEIIEFESENIQTGRPSEYEDIIID